MTPVQESAVLLTGASVTYLTHIAAFALAVTPALSALALVVSIVVGVLTCVWTIKKIRREK
jgi:uncharacterized membrane protein YqjE